MASSDSNQPLRPSLLERFEVSEHNRGESRFFEGIDVRMLKAEVAKSLEWLLNTRVWLPEEIEDLGELEETKKSLINYGIPDLSIYSWSNPQHCRKIAALVETAVRTYEPRLLPRSVRCEIVPTDDVTDFTLRLRIEAILYVDPISEHVTFDSTADLDAGGLRIEKLT